MKDNSNQLGDISFSCHGSHHEHKKPQHKEFIKAQLCSSDKQKPNRREENNSAGEGSRESKSKAAVLLELHWFWPRGQMEVLSKFQLQVKFELNLCLCLLLHVQPTARGIHTPVCAPASRTCGKLHFCSGF